MAEEHTVGGSAWVAIAWDKDEYCSKSTFGGVLGAYIEASVAVFL